MEQLRQEVDNLKKKLMESESKTAVSASDEDFQVKEKMYQEAKTRANKAEQEIESNKVSFRHYLPSNHINLTEINPFGTLLVRKILNSIYS